MRQCQVIKQNWAGERNSSIYFCVISYHGYQSVLGDWVLGSTSTHFCDFLNIFFQFVKIIGPGISTL